MFLNKGVGIRGLDIKGLLKLLGLIALIITGAPSVIANVSESSLQTETNINNKNGFIPFTCHNLDSELYSLSSDFNGFNESSGLKNTETTNSSVNEYTFFKVLLNRKYSFKIQKQTFYDKLIFELSTNLYSITELFILNRKLIL